MKRWILAGLLCCCSFGAAAQELVLVGSETVYSYLRPHQDDIRRDLGIELILRTGGSTQGLKRLNAHDGDVLAMVSRPLSLQERGEGLVAHTFGWDDIAILVHSSNPLNNLTLQQLESLYNGEATWQSFGGKGPVTWLTTGPNHGTSVLMHARLSEGNLAQHHLSLDTLDEVAVAVASVKGAISWMSLQTTMERSTQDFKILSVEGVFPRQANYAFHRPLQLVSKGELSTVQARLIAWLQTHFAER